MRQVVQELASACRVDPVLGEFKAVVRFSPPHVFFFSPSSAPDAVLCRVLPIKHIHHHHHHHEALPIQSVGANTALSEPRLQLGSRPQILLFRDLPLPRRLQSPAYLHPCLLCDPE